MLLLVVAIYVLFPKLVGARRGGRARSTRPTGTGSSWRIGFNVRRPSAPTWRCSAACSAARATTRCTAGSTCSASYQITMAGLAATRIFSAGRRRRDRAHLLGAAQGRDAAPARRLPDGRVPRPHLLRLPRRADRSSASCCGPACCPARRRSRAPSCPPRSRPALIVLFAADRADPAGLRAPHPALRAAATGARATCQRLAKGPATLVDRHAHRDRLPPPPAAAARSRSAGRSASGPPTSACCGRASRRSAGTSPFAVLVQGFFVGMAANLIPLAGRRRGRRRRGHDRRLRRSSASTTAVVFPAVLTYRVIAFWLPIPPGIVAFFQLRKIARGVGARRRGGRRQERLHFIK